MRPPLKVNLTDEARRGWDRSCAQWGTTRTGLFEAMGRLLDEHPARLPDLEDLLQVARTIDIERRSRS